MGAGQSSLSSYFTSHLSRNVGAQIGKSSAIAHYHTEKAKVTRDRGLKDIYTLQQNRKFATMVSTHAKTLIDEHNGQQLIMRPMSTLSSGPNLVQDLVLGMAQDPAVVNALTANENFDVFMQHILELESKGDEAAMLTVHEASPPLTPPLPGYGDMASAPPMFESSMPGRTRGLGHLCLALTVFGLSCPTCGSPAPASPLAKEPVVVGDAKGNEGALPHTHTATSKADARTVLVDAVMPVVVLLVVCSIMCHRGLARSARVVFSHCYQTFMDRVRDVPSLATSRFSDITTPLWKRC
eukprot:TRINITY_DN965_c0_g1_i1.p1 TRINITY_DN965_c0_g1~~TRINITY_DN965_c0_g1_i1.p1  ORF type:complete len:296 (+),score=67.03 TRINITY_DN965_c0_g1_i1:88-975(+)